ncbi:hypothetical protein U1Q18_034509 [Sarracenia purpurea var. burkii]
MVVLECIEFHIRESWLLAAKSVWLWTNLVAGGSPLPYRESTQIANTNKILNSESQNSISDSIQINQPAYASSGNSSLEYQKFNSAKAADSKFKCKYVQKSPNKPIISRASSAPVGPQEIKNDDYCLPPENAPTKQFKKAPHEFFGASGPIVSTSRSSPDLFHGHLDNSVNNCSTIEENFPNQYPQSRHAFVPDNIFTPNTLNNRPHLVPMRSDVSRFSLAPVSNLPNIGKLIISEDSNCSQSSNNFQQQFEFPNFGSQDGLQRGYSLRPTQPFNNDDPNNNNRRSSHFAPLSSTSVVADTVSGNGTWRTQGCLPLPEFVQGLIGVVLLALNSLKVEKIMPTEANITDCIRFGDPKHRNTDVRMALDYATEQHMVVKQNLGSVQLYVRKNERLWKCVNPIGSDLNQYPKEMWDSIRKFLASAAGYSAIMASQCRSACLKELALGDVLQILNMVITMKRWIFPHKSGWQPITINVMGMDTDTGTLSGL